MFPHFSSKYCISRVKSDKVVVKKNFPTKTYDNLDK